MLTVIAVLIAAGTALTNTTDEAVLGSHPIPAAWFQAGKVLKFETLVRVTDNNSTDTLVVRARFGDTTLTGTAIATTTAVDAVDEDMCLISGTIVCRDPSSSTSGTLVAMVASNDCDAAGEPAKHTGTVLSGVDLTGELLLEITGEWSVAHADNSCQLEALNVYEAIV